MSLSKAIFSTMIFVYEELWFQAIQDSCFFLIIISYLIFHSVRLSINKKHLKGDPHEDKSTTHLLGIDVKTASYIAILPTIANRLINPLIATPLHYGIFGYKLNDATCKWIVIAFIELGGLQKLGRNLFVLCRLKPVITKMASDCTICITAARLSLAAGYFSDQGCRCMVLEIFDSNSS